MEMKERDIALDIIRSVAIILVIFQHAWSGLGLDAPSSGAACWFNRAFCIGVPLFVMLSGALNLPAVRPAGEFLRKRFSRVLIPFLFWATLVFVLSAWMGKYPDVHSFGGAVAFFFSALLKGGINDSYWFVYLLVGLYLLAPLLQRAFHQSRALLEYALLLWIAVQFFKAFYPSFLPVRYYAFPVDVYLGYFLAGHYIRAYLPDKGKLRRYGAVAFVSGAVLNMLFLARGGAAQPAEMLESVGLFALLYSLSLPEGRLRRFTVNLSRYSYAVYLTQMVPVGALCAVWHAPAPLLPGLVLVVVLIEYGFCWCLDRWERFPKYLAGIQ